MGPSGTCAVELSGELTIRGIAEVRERMLAALQSGDHVVAQVADDAVTDLTFVQLLESVRRSAEARGQGFALSAPASGSLLEVLRRGGFLSQPDPAANRFWLMKSEDI